MKFTFASSTLRELAYEQLTFSVRRMLHRKIAEWYEYSNPDELDSFAFVIAKHWESGNVAAKAVRRYFQAAQFMETTQNFEGVMKATEKALQILNESVGEKVSESERLLVARIYILRCKTMSFTNIEKMRKVVSNLREAMVFISGGIDCFGTMWCKSYFYRDVSLPHLPLPALDED